MARDSILQSNGGSWGAEEESEDRSDHRKHLRWFALVLEIIGGIIIISVAVYLRMADLQPNAKDLNWEELCSDLTLKANPHAEDSTIFLYVITILVPLLFIVVVELEHTYSSTHSFFNKMRKSERFCKSLPRWTRILAMFILGAFLASFFADYLKLLVIRPRPYFIKVYGKNCPQAYNGTKNAMFYDSLKSFPSHLASVASFCCMFAVSYAHNLRRATTASVLVPIMSQAFLVLAVTASLDRYTANCNHIIDTVFGVFMGLVLAFYLSSLVAFQDRLSQEGKGDNWMNFWDMFIPRARVSLPPTMAEARNAVNI